MNTTPSRLFVAIFAVALGSAWAQQKSELPACPTNSTDWTDCVSLRDFGNNKYVGDFKNNTAHGQGTATFTNGSAYTGHYKDGRRHGQGTDTYGYIQNSAFDLSGFSG
jgi:hypothetical protein